MKRLFVHNKKLEVRKMNLNNPDAPANKKQLWLLHILTKEDTRAWNLTMQQASDKIQELKGNGNRPLVNPHATAIKQDQQLRIQQIYDKQQVKTKSTPLFTTVDAEQVLARRIDIHQAENYVKRIRNGAKKSYAKRYLQYLLGKAEEPELPHPTNLSFMAGQSVRIQLDEILT